MNKKENFITWLKRKWEEFLIFLHLRRKKEEEKRKQEEIETSMSKPVIIAKFFLGFFLGAIEYAVMRPKPVDIKELVDLDSINEEIKNLENKIDWLKNRIKKEHKVDKINAYEQKLEATINIIKELKDRTKIIKDNKRKAEAIKKELKDVEYELKKIETDINYYKNLIEKEKSPNKLVVIQKKLEEKENSLENITEKLEKIQKNYDRFYDVDLKLNDKEKEYAKVLKKENNNLGETKDLYHELSMSESVPSFLPLTQYLDESVVQEIVYKNKELKRDVRTLKIEVKETKEEAVTKEKQERERIKKEEEERLKREVDEVKESNEKITTNIEETELEVEKLVKKVEKAKESKKATIHFKGISKMIVNLSKMAVGLFSTILFKKPGIGLVIGAVILNNSIRGLRNALRLNKRKISYYKYTDITNEILKQKSSLKVSDKLLHDSLKQISSFRSEFENKFEDRIKELPEFKEILNKVDMVEREVLEKIEIIEKQKENLNKIEKENEKQKLKVREESKK